MRKILENNDRAKEKVASEAKDIESEVECEGCNNWDFLRKPNGIVRNVIRNFVNSFFKKKH